MRNSKAGCVGCHNDFYNGKNNLGVKRCWSLDGAKKVKKVEVPIHQRPPYSQPAVSRYSCYRKRGYAYLDPNEVKLINAICARKS